MNRLLYVMPYTHDIENMKRFYADAVGLSPRHESQFFVHYEGGSRGASFALLAMAPERALEIELCFETDDVEADVKAMSARGVEFLNQPRMQSFGKVAHLRDPEGRIISLLEPSPGIGIARAPATSKPDPEWQAGVAGALAAASSTATAFATAVQTPRFSTAILNCRDVAAIQAFYHQKLGLGLETESPMWVTFDAGGSTIALQPRALDADGQPALDRVSLGFTVGDLLGWANEARDRGVHFGSAPGDEGFGVAAEAVDPDGNELIFREPPPPPMFGEELAEEFDDETTLTRGAIRKPVKKGVHAVSRVALKPNYKTAGARKKTAKPVPKGKARKLPSIRGAGPDRTRAAPKSTHDPERLKVRQAVGRLKKAERNSLAQKKRAVARASKGKPVKHAAASRAKKKR